MITCKDCYLYPGCIAGHMHCYDENGIKEKCGSFQNKYNMVEVVRCKDCKYRNTPDCKMWYQCVICGDYHHWEKDEYYCSHGKRRLE